MEKLTIGKDPNQKYMKNQVFIIILYSRHLQRGQRSAKMADVFCLLHAICLPFTA